MKGVFMGGWKNKYGIIKVYKDRCVKAAEDSMVAWGGGLVGWVGGWRRCRGSGGGWRSTRLAASHAFWRNLLSLYVLFLLYACLLLCSTSVGAAMISFPSGIPAPMSGFPATAPPPPLLAQGFVRRLGCFLLSR